MEKSLTKLSVLSPLTCTAQAKECLLPDAFLTHVCHLSSHGQNVIKQKYLVVAVRFET